MALETNKGILHAEDVGTIENPVQNGTLALQTTSRGSRTAGQLYLYGASGWADYLTARSPTLADPVVTSLTGTTLTGTTLTQTNLLTNGAAGAVTSAKRILFKKGAIGDNSAADILTVTVPNAAHAAAIKLTLLSSNGGADAFESSRVAEGLIVIARTAGAAAVAVVATLDLAQIATVAGGATHTLAYAVSAITGAVDAANTFTVTVTINDTGSAGANQVVVMAEVINSNATGVTIAAA
jgi:hypothetical protein